MFSLIHLLLILAIKLSLCSILLFVALILMLKLWLEPVKGVCKCKTKLNGKVALVTGGNSGIGLETARDFAKRGARVIIACRNEAKSKEAVLDIIRTTANHNVEYRHLDLSKCSSIRRFAENFNLTVDRLDILVNNAGCAGVKQQPTEDGIDKLMLVNYLGPFLLTNLLLDKLISTKRSRIINVSSLAHHIAKVKIEDLAGLEVIGYFQKYANSKLCQILWTKALAKRLPDGVTVNALHPGVVKTNIFDKMRPPILRDFLLMIIQLVFKNTVEGAQTTIHLAVAPELANASGGFYADCKPTNASKITRDKDFIELVWEKSVSLTENKGYS